MQHQQIKTTRHGCQYRLNKNPIRVLLQWHQWLRNRKGINNDAAGYRLREGQLSQLGSKITTFLNQAPRSTKGVHGPTKGVHGLTKGVHGPTKGVLGPTKGVLGSTKGVHDPTKGVHGPTTL